jgi:preprotein translocase subunit SecD
MRKRPVLLLLLLLPGGCVGHAQPTVKAVAKPALEFRWAEEQPGEGLTEARVRGRDWSVYLHPEVLLTEADVEEAEARPEGEGAPAVLLRFTPSGGDKMAEATKANKGRLLAVLVDGEVVSAPRVQSRIKREAMVSGKFTPQEVEEIAARIRGEKRAPDPKPAP